MKFTPTILIHNITVTNLVNVLCVDLGNTELNYAALKKKTMNLHHMFWYF